MLHRDRALSAHMPHHGRMHVLKSSECKIAQRSIDLKYGHYIICDFGGRMSLCNAHYMKLVYNRECVECTCVIKASSKMFKTSIYPLIIPLVCREVIADLDVICGACQRRLERLLPPPPPPPPPSLAEPQSPSSTSPSASPASLPSLASPSTSSSSSSSWSWSPPSFKRFLKDIDDLGPTQKRLRIQHLNDEVDKTIANCRGTRDHIYRDNKVPAVELLHFSTAERQRIRTIECLTLASEDSIRDLKMDCATNHATKTSLFESTDLAGAYVSDPFRLVDILLSHSPSSIMAFGGDAGGKSPITKLGITYTSLNNVQSFISLLIYTGKDDYSNLSALKQPGLTSFEGTTHALGLTTIFDVFQHLINHKNAFLNGDWAFINAILGLKAPSSSNPCPICPVDIKSFLSSDALPYYNPYDTNNIHPSQKDTPLIIMPSERIVPTPLHLFLGIGNRIITIYEDIYGEDAVDASMQTVKTIRDPDAIGRSNVHTLNGPELSKWLTNNCSEVMRQASDNQSDDSYAIFDEWLDKLKDYLLGTSDWTDSKKQELSALVHQIRSDWLLVSNNKSFPKLHMLLHASEFVQRHGFLNKVSEAATESYHHIFNIKYLITHKNSIHYPSLRIRRCLADELCKTIQPILKRKQSNPYI